MPQWSVSGKNQGPVDSPWRKFNCKFWLSHWFCWKLEYHNRDFSKLFDLCFQVNGILAITFTSYSKVVRDFFDLLWILWQFPKNHAQILANYFKGGTMAIYLSDFTDIYLLFAFPQLFKLINSFSNLILNSSHLSPILRVVFVQFTSWSRNTLVWSEIFWVWVCLIQIVWISPRVQRDFWVVLHLYWVSTIDQTSLPAHYFRAIFFSF